METSLFRIFPSGLFPQCVSPMCCFRLSARFLISSELIINRADSRKQHMGLTHWGNSPEGKILKSDVSIAKNYLSKDELQSLGRIVNAYLDLAEERAKRKMPMTME